MKVLIVAKTRRGSGACVGGITEEGRSVRLIARDATTNPHAGLEYNVGEVWEIKAGPDPTIVPPHVENIIVVTGRLVRRSKKLEETILRFMPPVEGGLESLFDGLTQATDAGALYVTARTGLPSRSTMFWVPGQALRIDTEGKRIRYRYPTTGGGRTLTFVGFQEPLQEIPAGTLLRVSLAHPWRPEDRPEEELRCFVQLSGWYLPTEVAGAKLGPVPVEPDEKRTCTVEVRPQTSARPLAEALARARDILKHTFGFASFLPVQEEVVSRVLQKRDTLVVMPTGGGKSLCYQLPALVWDGVTVVVSPLVALMQDQVRQLQELEIPAACLNHMVAWSGWTTVTRALRRGEIRILYLAPETLQKPETLLLLEASKVACLAVDEAHCISEWGHDFRPDYRQLRDVRKRFANAVCLALTATATTRVRTDIHRQLDIPPEGEFVASFNRPNLFLGVEPRRDGLTQILMFLAKRQGESGIIYCNTRKQTEELCTGLNANGWMALPYHAGLEDDVRRRNQEQFIQDEAPLLVATVAFGMGINKSNVRFVVHAHLPKDLESYYQEIGRAGRDGLPAYCLLLHSRADAMVHRHFIDQGALCERPGRQARLEAILRFAEVRDCRRSPLLSYFGERFEAPCGHCDNCRRGPQPADLADVTAAAQKVLSCAQLTGEVFGAAHLIAVLRGSKSEKVLSRGHDRLPMYGGGSEHSAEQWRELVREFLQLGLLDQDFRYGSLRVTAKGREVLAGNEKVRVPAMAAPVPGALDDRPQPQSSELFDRLRALRRELAAGNSIPPYMVFSDRTLTEIAARLPRTEAQFLTVNGVGEAKLTRYGGAFLRLIHQYCGEHGLPVADDEATTPASPILRPPL